MAKSIKHLFSNQVETLYRKTLDRVDKIDWMINKCRIKIFAKTWYFPIFTNLIDMAVINAHVVILKLKKEFLQPI